MNFVVYLANIIFRSTPRDVQFKRDESLFDQIEKLQGRELYFDVVNSCIALSAENVEINLEQVRLSGAQIAVRQATWRHFKEKYGPQIEAMVWEKFDADQPAAKADEVRDRE